MSTVGLDSILANQSSVDTATKTASSSHKDTFLKLLVTQLQYQDPLNPIENTDFTAQLAQFTQLETLTDMGQSLDMMRSLQGSINNIQTLSFIGKQVSATGNTLNYAGNDVGISFVLDDPAADVEVNIYSEQGTRVRSIELGAADAGDCTLTWDGTNTNGEKAASGRYTFIVEATDYNGRAVGSKSYTMGEVTGVRYDGGMTYLIIGDKEVTISDVDKISG
ncbi:MAG TPA: hypothetical protein ENN05_06750 [Deltaproteobacteria bacterium]|nr:hypothetical protein [Deltaproteobacteria bacterium]